MSLIKSILYLFAVATLFSSCSSSNRFASLFSKRKYTKGYYTDAYGTIKTTAKPSDMPPARSRATTNTISLSTNNVNIATNGAVANTKSSTIQTRTHAIVKTVEGLISRKSATHVTQSAVTNDGPSEDEPAQESVKDVNFVSIAGLVFSIAGAIVSATAGFFTIAGISLIVAAAFCCIYGLFMNKIYWTWLSILGLCILVIFFTLLLL